MSASQDYAIIDRSQTRNLNGWMSQEVAERQNSAFAPLIQALRAGNPRLDFAVAAKAVQTAAISEPLVLEVGCGSGYYSEALSLLLSAPVRYVGLDYSPAMVKLARQIYPNTEFLSADACCLPFDTGTIDIVLLGTSLMHIPDYASAIRESARVAKRCCIFHTVPVLTNKRTTMIRKKAYGEPVAEIIFNERELRQLLDQYGLLVRDTWESIPYDVSHVVGEKTWTITYLCDKSKKSF